MFPGWMAPTMVAAEDALPGRPDPVAELGLHRVLGTSLAPPYPAGTERVVVAMGCFWGAERRFWELPGVVVTVAGYAGGYTPNPTYDEVCSGRTGHAEAVLVVFDPEVVSREAVLRCFWEGHDPTQGLRQGNDVGSQYRSALFVDSHEQLDEVRRGRDRYDLVLRAEHFDPVTTEVRSGVAFFPAEPEHQQRLALDPDGYCGEGGTGVAWPGSGELDDDLDDGVGGRG